MKPERATAVRCSDGLGPHAITQTLQPILESICRDRQRFQIEEVDTKFVTLVRVTAARSDYTTLRGRDGRVQHATARIVKWASEVHRVNFKYLLNDSGGVNEDMAFSYDLEFQIGDALGLIREVLLLLKLSLFSEFKPLAMKEMPNGEFKIYIPCTEDEEPIINDINELFYCYGYVNGRILKVRPKLERKAKV